MMPKKGCFDYTTNESSYIERMHKCSGAQWEKRLESKHRDFHRKKLNNSKAGVVNTGSSQGFEGFSRSPPEINSIRSLTAFGNHSLLARTTESRIQDTELDAVPRLSKSDSYCLLIETVDADDRTIRLRQ